MSNTVNLDIPQNAAERARRAEAANFCECPRCGRQHRRLVASPSEQYADKAIEIAVAALREPDPSMARVANTVRQSIANIIEAQKQKIDRYGLALMMIREGCDDPRGLAKSTLEP